MRNPMHLTILAVSCFLEGDESFQGDFSPCFFPDGNKNLSQVMKKINWFLPVFVSFPVGEARNSGIHLSWKSWKRLLPTRNSIHISLEDPAWVVMPWTFLNASRIPEERNGWIGKLPPPPPPPSAGSALSRETWGKEKAHMDYGISGSSCKTQVEQEIEFKNIQVEK